MISEEKYGKKYAAKCEFCPITQFTLAYRCGTTKTRKMIFHHLHLKVSSQIRLVEKDHPKNCQRVGFAIGENSHCTKQLEYIFIMKNCQRGIKRVEVYHQKFFFKNKSHFKRSYPYCCVCKI